MNWNDHIQQVLDTLPDKPGCYLMKDAKGHIIYVGKAINLQHTVPDQKRRTTPPPTASTTLDHSCPMIYGKPICFQPAIIKIYLAQILEAPTRMRTCPGPGSGKVSVCI